MRYHEPISLTNHQEIIDEFANYIDRYNDRPMDLIMLSHHELEWLDQRIKDQVSAHVGHNTSPSYAFITIMAPHIIGGIHIDADRLDPPKDQNNWAINIPILNCTQGIMHWYNGNTKVILKETPEGTAYIQIENPNELVEVDQKLIDEPTIVRINTPHSVSNKSDNVRILLSIRFHPDLRPYDY